LDVDVMSHLQVGGGYLYIKVPATWHWTWGVPVGCRCNGPPPGRWWWLYISQVGSQSGQQIHPPKKTTLLGTIIKTTINCLNLVRIKK
jgi:hypothetical protein